MWNERLKEIVKRLPHTHSGVAVWDDYNQRFSQDQDVIGTITTNIGSPTPRNGIKIIEVFEPISVAMIGRNPNNPSERGKSNGNYKQRLEMNESGVVNTITSVQKDGIVTEPRVEQVGNIYPDTDTFKNRTMGRVYSNEGLSPTVNCCGGGDREPKVVINSYRIRKITPREAFRLMGVDDADIDKIQASGISNSQQYKMAGNSIVVDVLYHIFRKMFVETENETDTLRLF